MSATSTMQPAPTPDFDRIAHAYRWMEYLSFGRRLERCRFHFLPHLHQQQQALVLGDGDGRFLSRLLLQNPLLTADAVDSSPVMLALLQQRCATASPQSNQRLALHTADIRHFTPPRSQYDLVVTHFFLDCLSDAEIAPLAHCIRQHTAQQAVWLVSEFSIPAKRILRLPARLLIRSLYFAFRWLTGLEAGHLPNHSAALQAAGFLCKARQPHLGGLLVSELWQRG
jgi:ubiquinone/menaquinone biosynthesis C-methylase UbiE